MFFEIFMRKLALLFGAKSFIMLTHLTIFYVNIQKLISGLPRERTSCRRITISNFEFWDTFQNSKFQFTTTVIVQFYYYNVSLNMSSYTTPVLKILNRVNSRLFVIFEVIGVKKGQKSSTMIWYYMICRMKILNLDRKRMRMCVG